MGYGDDQIRELEQTITTADCDLVLIWTPIDLGRLLKCLDSLEVLSPQEQRAGDKQPLTLTPAEMPTVSSGDIFIGERDGEHQPSPEPPLSAAPGRQNEPGV